MYRLTTPEQRKYYDEFMYPWQDEIFAMIHSRKFYLTGGTCLSRFYYQHRYSDDLDFFFDGTLASKQTFEIEVNEIATKIKKSYNAQVLVNDEYFKRIMVYKNDKELKCEFIYEPTVSINQRQQCMNYDFLLDTKENVIANKLCAIYNRKTYKDYVDLMYLTKEFDLKQAIEWSEEKMVPMDYEGAVMTLIEGKLSGDLVMLQEISVNNIEEFVKQLTTKLIDYARTV